MIFSLESLKFESSTLNVVVFPFPVVSSMFSLCLFSLIFAVNPNLHFSSCGRLKMKMYWYVIY